MRAQWLRAAAVGVLLIGVAACTDDAPPGEASPSSSSPAFVVPDEPVVGGTLRLGVERLRTMDPAAISPASQSELLLADLLYDGLPALASSVTPAADLTAWTFGLRADQSMVAADVKYSLERVAQQGTGSLAGSRLEMVKGYGDFLSGYTSELAGVVVVDDATVRIELIAPFASLPDVLSAPSFGIVPRDGTMAGTGPYRSAGGAAAGDVVRLVRADGAPGYLDAVELHQYDDLRAAYDDFIAASLDWTLVPPDLADDAVEAQPFQAEMFYAFNLLNPKFADVRLRQAIVKAIDRTRLVPDALPMNGVVPSGVPGHVPDACGSTCAYDPAGARALLAAAFPSGAPSVNLDYFEDEDEERIAVAIEAALVAVGIPVTRRPKSDAEYDQFVTSGQQELFRFGWIGAFSGPEAYLTALFKAGSRDNVTGFASADVDGLLASAQATADPTARATLFQQAEAAIMQQVPIVPIAQFQTRAVMSPRVQGLELRTDGTFDSSAVWLVP